MNTKECYKIAGQIRSECSECVFEKIEIERVFIFKRLVIDRYHHSKPLFLKRSDCKKVINQLMSTNESERLRKVRCH